MGVSRDLETKTASPMDVQTNPFCANGMHLPNGSFVVFGGNNAVGPGGNNDDAGSNTTYDPIYMDYGGTKAIRLITPCDGDVNTDAGCTWIDSPNGLQMQSSRWYPGAEALGNGSVIIIGGFSAGGYINRNYPNDDPFWSHNASNPTYEVYPNNGVTQRVMQFMGKTSGLNSYALTYLMASGNLFVQANYSTSTLYLKYHHFLDAKLTVCAFKFSGTPTTTSKRHYPTCQTRSSASTPLRAPTQ